MNLKQKKEVKDLLSEFEEKMGQIEGTVGKKIKVEGNFEEFCSNESEEVSEGLRLYSSAFTGIIDGFERIGDLHGADSLEGINIIRLQASSSTDSPSATIEGDTFIADFRISDRSSGFWWDKMDTADYLENNL